MKIEETIKCLQKSGRKTLTLQDLKKLLRIESNNTAYKTAEILNKKEILIRLRKGLYRFAFSSVEDYELANALYSPSYISLETSLNFYGLLSQFPYTITSVTPRKTQKIEAVGKEFEFVHIQKELFWGYDKEKDFLIAQPEKALIDELYLVSKGWRKIDLKELDYSKCNTQQLKGMAAKIHFAPFQKLWKELKL